MAYNNRHQSSVVSKAREYCDINSNQPRSYWDYESLLINWSTPSDYEIIRKIGGGRYSEVFEGYDTKTNRPIAVKILKPVKKSKIKRQIKILQNLKNGTNIIQLYDVVKDTVSGVPALIFEYVNNTNFNTLFSAVTDHDVRYYMFELLKAINYCHSCGIIHRDIQPQNIMIDHSKRILRLIDFGSAEFYHPYQKYNVRTANRYTKAPELLLNMRMYDYSLDMFNFGCVFAGIIFQKMPFFHGRDNFDMLVRIAQVLGTAELYEYVKKYDLKLNPVMIMNGMLRRSPSEKKRWTIFDKCKEKYVNNEALDFVDKVLRYDHNERLTAREAMQHPYFKEFHEELRHRASLIVNGYVNKLMLQTKLYIPKEIVTRIYQIYFISYGM